MSWTNLFKKENIPALVKVFSKREIVYLANKALEEEPDNKSIKAYRERLLKGLETEHSKKARQRDIGDYLKYEEK